MKKLLVFTLLFITSLSLVACDTTPEKLQVDCEIYPTHVDCLEDAIIDDPIVNPVGEFDPADIGFLDIYYINDFHGAILEDSPDELGFANIANLLITQKELYPENTIILAGGDILQGSALSNYYSGLSTINLMNEMYFDAFTVGNHEFDWGIEVVTNYFDGNADNGEANFPLLGANIFYKGTTTIPDYIDPYVIIERGDVKIGIIGTMGYGLEYSIATSKIEDYEFALPVPIISDIVYEMRTELDVDIVLVASHDSGNSLNPQLAALTGDYKVDAIFNGHSHNTYADTYLGLPVVQSGGYGEYVGHIRFELTNNELSTYKVENFSYYSNELLRSPNDLVKELIEHYQLETDPIFNVPLITTGEYFTQTDLSEWIARMMRISTGADIGFQNGGGTRTSIPSDTVVTLAVLYQVWPFDNVVKTVDLTGAEIKSLMSGLIYDTDITEFDDDTIYKVATNDYTFDKPTNPFIYGDNPFNTGIILRDLAETELEMQSLEYDYFYYDNAIITTEEE
jgi:2',3'-cyclic-nucleotide 2'-phosphodiesterase (5'-nucleotidase family)